MELREAHLQSTREFLQKARELGYGDLGDYFWYHTIDLGNSLVTPGCYDFRPSLPLFQFPEDMDGMRVLDVGAATGFFSFEFESRGAEVVSLEMTSLSDLDAFPGENINHTVRKIKGMMRGQSTFTLEQVDRLFGETTPDEIYSFLLDGPFQFCRKVLGSQVKRCYSNIYDLSSQKTGGDFDLVFIGDVLLHTLYPLKALAAVAPLCRQTLVLSQALPASPDYPPAMFYVGGDQLGQDEVSWFWPNRSCFEQILKKLGFRRVSLVASHTGVVKPGGGRYDRAIIHATR